MMKPFVRVKVPATSANLGPGFDVLGLALCLYNTVEIYQDNEQLPFMTIYGEGADQAPKDASNLVIRAFHKVFAYRNKEVPTNLSFVMDNQIPFARGLGSSSAAACSGLLAAQAFLEPEEKLSEKELVDLACAFDGHPDNTTAALLGGLVLACQYSDGLLYRRLPLHNALQATVVIPDYELSTQIARSVLPPNYTREACIHNLGSLGFLLHAFEMNDQEALRYGLRDAMHVPYRLDKMPGMADIINLALAHNGIGATVSGAGSTIIIFHDDTFDGVKFEQQVKQAYPSYFVRNLAIDRQGGQITSFI